LSENDHDTFPGNDYHLFHATWNERNLMPAVTFDTLAAARTLQAADMGKDHAEAIAAITRDAADAASDDAATRTDLAGLKAELKADMAELKAELKADMVTLTWRMVGQDVVLQPGHRAKAERRRLARGHDEPGTMQLDAWAGYQIVRHQRSNPRDVRPDF